MNASLSHSSPPANAALAAAFAEQRQHTRAYLLQLHSEEDWFGPEHPALNPPLWEWLHLNWFAEYWCVRHAEKGTATRSWLTDADHRFNSALLAHAERWRTSYPSLTIARQYDAYVFESVSAAIADAHCPPYFAALALHHEAMHEENFMRRAQRLGQPFRSVASAPLERNEWLYVPAHDLVLGRSGGAFGFDNEFGSQTVALSAFAISRVPMSETAFEDFVLAGGYQQRAWWSEPGWQWRERRRANHPYYWQRRDGEWYLADFTDMRRPSADRPMRYLNAHEAEAYCAYVSAQQAGTLGRRATVRLPTAAEWQLAYPQLQVLPMWEWTADSFAPYPGFEPGPYTDYSTTSFGHTRELRGHSPLLHTGLCRCDFRNFFAPQRRDVCAGFRLCYSTD